jgi:uncharacterized phage protein (predicted DNA packaging)
MEPLTLSEAKIHLRVDGEDEDALISSLITASREVVENYTGYTVDEIVEQRGNFPESLKSAMKLLIGHLYANRESTIIGVSVSELPMASEYLMNPYRNYSL